MSTKLKSSWELALDKLQAKGETIAEDRLSEDQKHRINELRKQYAAKLAEREIMFKDKLNSLSSKVKPQDYLAQRADMEKNYLADVARFKQELEDKIAAIRKVA